MQTRHAIDAVTLAWKDRDDHEVHAPLFDVVHAGVPIDDSGDELELVAVILHQP